MLSLSTSSPLRDPSSLHGFGRSFSSISSAGSEETVQHHRLRSLSGSSLSSLSSLWTPAFRRPPDTDPSRSTSSHSLTLRRFPTRSDRRSLSSRSASGKNSRRTSFASVLSSRFRTEPLIVPDSTDGILSEVAETDWELSEGKEEDFDFVEGSRITPQTPAAHNQASPSGSVDQTWTSPQRDAVDRSANQSFTHRWMNTLRRRKQGTTPNTTPRTQRWHLDGLGSRAASPVKIKISQHKNSDSLGSSFAFVSAVKSASATIASFGKSTVSKRNTPWRYANHRSSLISISDPRPSVNSQRSADEAEKQRSRKRRARLEELIRSEESYVADIKALSNAYFTVLGNQPTSASFTRSSAQKTISDILHLHDDLLGQLHRVVPFAEFDQRIAKTGPNSGETRFHTRWHSVDAVVTRTTPVRSKLVSIRQGRRSLNISRSSEEEQIALRCAPQTIKHVAKTFSAHIDRFAVYEDYGVNYELVQRDIDETQRAITTWSDFDRAIEAISAHVNPVKSREANKKKAMTLKDLLIKPVQRLPRYELLFSDLCKLTPVCDDPDSNTSIQELLTQLNDACQRMNEAKDNPSRSRLLETTFLLGDRLTYSNQVPRSIFLQLLGQVHLCGCLHIAYRSKDRIKGCYAICVLFESTLLLASAEEEGSKYGTLAGIPLANATVVECDNGKGLQCHTAPHSWKTVFEYSARMYEFIFTACSAVEAEIWRQHLGDRIEAHAAAVAAGSSNVFELQSPLISEMRSAGKAFGKPDSFVRRMSVHRTATVGPTTDLNQVIIKNTQAVKEALDNSSSTSLQIPRSQSVATPSHVQTLAPRRVDRVRLESILSDVWTKDVLPYPGMQPRRSDPLRASANHVIRKFSMASITSNFSSKRSASFTSIAASRKEDLPPPKAKSAQRDRGYSKSSRPPLVDFHTAPEAFLPEDFELHDPATKRKRSALRTLTMTMERPFSPLLGNEPKTSGIRRTQSVRQVSPKPQTPLPSQDIEPSARPVYSVVQDRPKTPAKLQKPPPSNVAIEYTEADAKTPRKSKSKNKLLRLFG